MVLLILCWQLLDKIFAVFTCAEGKAKETHHPSALLSYLSSLERQAFRSTVHSTSDLEGLTAANPARNGRMDQIRTVRSEEQAGF